jgi:hypothetical protein
MNLHPFLRLCVHGVVPSSCTSLALQPAAGVQHPCSQACAISHHLPPQSSKPMQGKIKGSGTTVRTKPCLHMVWHGTRWPWRGAVSGAVGQRSDAWDRQP